MQSVNTSLPHEEHVQELPATFENIFDTKKYVKKTNKTIIKTNINKISETKSYYIL